MNKKIIFGSLITLAGIAIVFFIYRLTSPLPEKCTETRMGNVVFCPDTLPKEYSMLFHTQQLKSMTVSSITYNEGDFPICILSFMDQYDVIIFKRKIDTTQFQLSKFLTVERPLNTNLVNERSYSATDGYINFQWATETTTRSLNNIVMAISEKGKLTQEISNEKEVGYIIDDWQKLNFFYERQKNADLIFTMNPLPSEKPTAAIGLLLKQVDNGICLLFVLPKDNASPLISKQLLQTLI